MEKIPYSNFLDSIDNVKRVIDNRVSQNPNDEELRLCSHLLWLVKINLLHYPLNEKDISETFFKDS